MSGIGSGPGTHGLECGYIECGVLLEMLYELSDGSWAMRHIVIGDKYKVGCAVGQRIVAVIRQSGSVTAYYCYVVAHQGIRHRSAAVGLPRDHIAHTVYGG